ncbi:hypothetical protein TD95_004281 [Thielaviopsis punctulata]|uniref:EamA domain-containing protein n=1 Tax=Thielaviopsis punctulata TaxID=72032 RepID=A0A0F4ZC97_9PEZI|nr:hypothetical protein TD95_004280 [Thielaviopsis punctulata]KKA28158.1 hypothetical protein TD95_004281 [Thielaviopsis punctulata]
MTTSSMVPVLVAMMLLTGVSNTMLTKFQDQQCVSNCDSLDPSKRKHFEQPVWQTLQMFVGEMGCWLVIGLTALYNRYSRTAAYTALPTTDTDTDTDNTNTTPTAHSTLLPKPDDAPNTLRGTRVVLLALPAICDICGTTLMNVGLLLVAASIYQMTRGALVLFVGLFSVIFLRHKLHAFQWLSLAGVVAGVAVVGLAGAIYPDHPRDAVAKAVRSAVEGAPEKTAALAVVGVLLIAGAQIFTATQFVLEEWIMANSPVDPITMVGYEGIFGFLVTLFGMAAMHVVYGQTDAGRGSIFDMAEGWRQMTSSRELVLSSFLIMISIGGFNFFGLSVTRSVSATSRSTIDTCRTLFIWIASLALGWETFKWLQVLGFVLLVYFTFVFNGLVQPPLKCLRVDEPVEELLPEEPIEHI